jgi:hypothetical protein
VKLGHNRFLSHPLPIHYGSLPLDTKCPELRRMTGVGTSQKTVVTDRSVRHLRSRCLKLRVALPQGSLQLAKRFPTFSVTVHSLLQVQTGSLLSLCHSLETPVLGRRQGSVSTSGDETYLPCTVQSTCPSLRSRSG